MIRAKISGVAGFVPEDRLTNEMLSQMVDTNDEWIFSRTGIKERRMLKGEGLGMSYMAEQAVRLLLEKTKTKPEEIDVVICTTITQDMLLPSVANLVCYRVGMTNAWGFDLQAACSGFLYGLETVTKFVESGKYKKAILISGDKMSSIIDYTDRNTCVIFGDGCGAVLVEPTEENVGIMDSKLYSDGSGWQYLHIKAGGSAKPSTIDTLMAGEQYVYQEGQKVYVNAIKNMADVAIEVMERNHLTADNIQWLVPHQANKRIIESTRERVGLPVEKVMVNIQNYGNTTNGTIPLCLWDYEKQLKKGDNIILASFGGGFTWGAIYLKWAY
ncbi:MAG: ketoacyl-ACP synthase III [Chitinophagales bacterium]|nr:ketoacyl-ACP synthase III [Chitinophagales bacterium]